jgi:ATP-dependent Lon protease
MGKAEIDAIVNIPSNFAEQYAKGTGTVQVITNGRATSIASAITQRKVRKNIAMTGEITLRGKVLPVGGIKEKILAAKRAGITDIVICKENKKNILDIPEDVADVWEFALTDEKVKHPIDFTIPENDKKEKK